MGKAETKAEAEHTKPTPEQWQFHYRRNYQEVCRFCGWGKDQHDFVVPLRDGTLRCMVEFEPPYASLNDAFLKEQADQAKTQSKSQPKRRRQSKS